MSCTWSLKQSRIHVHQSLSITTQVTTFFVINLITYCALYQWPPHEIENSACTDWTLSDVSIDLKNTVPSSDATRKLMRVKFVPSIHSFVIIVQFVLPHSLQWSTRILPKLWVGESIFCAKFLLKINVRNFMHDNFSLILIDVLLLCGLHDIERCLKESHPIIKVYQVQSFSRLVVSYIFSSFVSYNSLVHLDYDIHITHYLIEL